MRTPSSSLTVRRWRPAAAAVLLVASLGFGGHALADSDASSPGVCPPKPPSQEIKKHEPRSMAADFMKKRWGKIDTNKDGIISKEEYLKEAADRFDATDANHDGKLTPDEVKAFFDKIDADRAKADALKKKCASDAATKP